MRTKEAAAETVDFCSSEFRNQIISLFRYAQAGRCISSVVHDANNVLGASLAYAELIQISATLDSESSRMLSEIIQGIRKCSAVLGSLTSISRKDRMSANMVDITRIIDEVLALSRHDQKVSQITVEANYEQNLPAIVIDEAKVKHAVLCLLWNAREALEDEKDRRITVQTRKTADGVEIAIWNSGPVIPESDRDCIFDPFFTTKGEGHLGLGLSLTREAALLHGGDVTYDADQGFVLRLTSQVAQSQ